MASFRFPATLEGFRRGEILQVRGLDVRGAVPQVAGDLRDGLQQFGSRFAVQLHRHQSTGVHLLGRRQRGPPVGAGGVGGQRPAAIGQDVCPLLGAFQQQLRSGFGGDVAEPRRPHRSHQRLRHVESRLPGRGGLLNGGFHGLPPLGVEHVRQPPHVPPELLDGFRDGFLVAVLRPDEILQIGGEQSRHERLHGCLTVQRAGVWEVGAAGGGRAEALLEARELVDGGRGDRVQRGQHVLQLVSAEQFGGGEGGFPVAGRRHASAAHRDPFVADASQGTVGSPQEVLDPLAFQRGHRPEHSAAHQRPGEVGELLGQLGGGVDGHDPFGGQVGHPSGRGQVPVPHPTEHPVCQYHPGAQQPVVGGVQDGHVDAVAGRAALHQPGDPDGVRQQGRGISLEGKVETHHRRSLETHGTYLPTRPGKTGATLEVTNWLGQNPSPGWLIRAASTRPQTSSPWFRHDRLAAAREDRLNQLQGRQSRLIRPVSPWASCQTPVLWRLVYLVPVVTR